MSLKEIYLLTPGVREKFWKRVNKATGIGPAGNCWRWTGHFAGKYPKFCLGGKMVPAGRIALWIATGLEPKGQIGHCCQSSDCVNPEHLVAGSTGLYALDNDKRPQPALLQPDAVGVYTDLTDGALSKVATQALLAELERRATESGLKAGVVEQLGAFLNSNSNSDTSPDGRNDLLLSLQCEANICGDGAAEPFLTYTGAVMMKWFNDDDDDDDLVHYSTLGRVRFTIIKWADELHTRMAELEAGVVLEVYRQLFKHPVDADGVEWAQCVHDTHALNDGPTSLFVIEELTLEDAVSTVPLHAWIVDALFQHFDCLGRVVVAWCGDPADGAEHHRDRHRIQTTARWASAGLLKVPGTDFFLGDMDHHNPPLPRLPSIDAMLNKKQKLAPDVSDVLY